jgi:hypothetical protein
MAAYALAPFREATLAAAQLRIALWQAAEAEPAAGVGDGLAVASAAARRQAAGGEGR